MAIAIAPQPADVTTSRPIFILRTREELQDIAAREPANPMPLYLLANILRRDGDPRWRSVVNEAMARMHHAPQRIYSRALARMLLEDWGGWTDYEMRLHNPDTIRDLTAFRDLCWRNRRWDGEEDLAGQSLLVLPEQGLGDCLQMWRFLPALVRSVGTPMVMVYDVLVPLARHHFGKRVKIWLYAVKPTVPLDRYVWGLSLPSIFGGLPPFEPLSAPRRRPRLVSRERPMRAGLCWAGAAGYLHDPDRSIAFNTLAPLLGRPDIEWVSLQVGARAADGHGHPALQTPDPPLVTFADTADLVSQLDYVVTVDTSVAHLAGLMGIPTYLVLQYDSHWRWGLGETTPWYPSLRLVRQPTFGDWTGAVHRVSTLIDQGTHASFEHRAT